MPRLDSSAKEAISAPALGLSRSFGDGGKTPGDREPPLAVEVAGEAVAMLW